MSWLSSDSKSNQEASKPPQESSWKTPPRQGSAFTAGVAASRYKINRDSSPSSKSKGTLEASTNRVLNSSFARHRYTQKRAQVVFVPSSPEAAFSESVLDTSFVSTTSSATTVARVNSAATLRKARDCKILAIVKRKAISLEPKLVEKQEEEYEAIPDCSQEQHQFHQEEEEEDISYRQEEEEEDNNSQGTATTITTEVQPQATQEDNTIPETPKRIPLTPTSSSSLPPTHPSAFTTPTRAGTDHDDDDVDEEIYNIMVASEMSATTPRASHRRHQQGRPTNTAGDPEDVVQSVEQAKQLLQQHQQQQQRQLQQLQQDHYQNKASTSDNNSNNKASKDAVANVSGTGNTSATPSPETKQKERTFQQQYMEQQAQLDRETSAYDQNHRNRRPSSPYDTGALPQAKLVGAATAMSTHFTFAMNKFQEMLQPSSSAFGSNSRLVYTATSESFTSSLAADGGEEKKTADEDDEGYDDDDYDDINTSDLDEPAPAGCSLYGRSAGSRYASSHSHYRKDKTKRTKRKSAVSSSRQHRDLAASPSAASSILSYSGTDVSSVTDPTNTGGGNRHTKESLKQKLKHHHSMITMLEEISPMMRMRNQEAQHAVEISASSSEQTSNVMAPTKSNKERALTTTKQRQTKENKKQTKKWSLKKTLATKQSSDDSLILRAQSSTASSYKTEEQVKAEKQRNWKRKMKLAQKQRLQEQDELGEDIVVGSYSTSIDDDDDTARHELDLYDDDLSQMSYGCQPGSNLGEIIWASISGIDPPNRSTTKAVAKNPVDVLQKLVSARCGELREVSSSEDEDDDEGFSYSDEENEARKGMKKLSAGGNDDAEVKDVKLRRSRGRGDSFDRRGRSRRPRSRSPYSTASQVSRSSRHSQLSLTSRHSETSIGDILDSMAEDDKGGTSSSKGDYPRAHRELELKLLKEKANFRILGKHKKSKEEESGKADEPSKVADASKAADHKAAKTVVSTDTSVTPVAGTTGGSVMSGKAGNYSVLSGSEGFNHIGDIDRSHGLNGSVLSDVSKKSSRSKASIHSVKSVSFDENTIVKTSQKVSIPTISNLEKSDPNFIKNFVAGLGHHGVPLLWHKAPTAVKPAGPSGSSVATDASCVHPETVRAYLKIQSTQNTSGTFDGFGDALPTPIIIDTPATWDSPRLVWYEESNSGESPKDGLGHFDLFDIASIETASSMPASFLQVLEAFPFSMPSRTLVIQLNRPSNHYMHSTQPAWFVPSSTTVESTSQAPLCNMIVLEAMNDDDAKTLVLGMKWMVARLSFNLIVGNLSISCEMLRPEQQQGPVGGDSATNGSGGDEDSMGPRRLPMIRRTKVMNDITFHMIDRVLEKASRYQQAKRSELEDDFLK